MTCAESQQPPVIDPSPQFADRRFLFNKRRLDAVRALTAPVRLPKWYETCLLFSPQIGRWCPIRDDHEKV